MATTNVPSITFTTTGVVLPAESSILAGEFADMQTAFGGGMSESLSSPQGQLAQSFSAIIGDKNNEIANVVNNMDPNYASGRFQDAIGSIYFIQRIAAVGTVVQATCTGLVGTLIPTGSLAQDTSGNLYQSLAPGTIGPGGTVSIEFQCQTTGPIAVGIGQLSTIFRAITGWESITNPAAGATGFDVESRADFEFRRANSVAANATGSPPAVLASVLSVTNVIDAYVIDNSTNATVNTGPTNYPVIANSIYVAVAGGAASDIANAIWNKKSLGCSYNGTTTYTITDTSSVYPYPTYLVKWVTPTSTPIYITVNIVNNPLLPSNIVSLVQASIVSAFNGQDGGTRARIGASIFSGRYYAPVSATSQYTQIISLFVGESASPSGSVVNMGIDQLPTLSTSNIVVNLV
jgi:hypothetical protein